MGLGTMRLRTTFTLGATVWLSTVGGICAPVAAGPSAPKISTISEAFRQPWSRFFWIERRSGKYRMGDPASDFSRDLDLEHLTFDISNTKALANVGVQGAIRNLTIYRDSYRATSHPRGWSGVWTAKDTSSFGPYAYTVRLGNEAFDLAAVDWDFRTGLLDNIFPITELYDPGGRMTIRLLTYAPVSADGSQRLRGIIYGIQLENTSGAALKGVIVLPRPFADHREMRGNTPWHLFDPYEFEIGIGDAPAFHPEVPFELQNHEAVWVPTILYMPGEPTIDQVNARGSAGWLDESWGYYRGVLGRLETPGEPYLAEFYERQLMQALQSIGMSGTGKLAGTNWGSYPVTRQIWSKDAYYSCLPITLLDPSLAPKIIEWFEEFGVRHPGNIVAGGVNHSLSLSVASVVLAGYYYAQTGDKRFFLDHPEFEAKWHKLLQEVLDSRVERGIWLFPSRFISDGALECDYHTGSNVVAWKALKAYARLLEEVYGKPDRAREYAAAAESVRAAILAKTVIEGPFGPQFIEGVHRDRRPPLMISDGEESDTTLMPFYGFLQYDNPAYLNYMHFSMTEHNRLYHPGARAITWDGSPETPLDKRVVSTAPGYMKGIAFGATNSMLFGDPGYYTEVRKVTDADGSVWWWPYGDSTATPGFRYGKVIRGVPGKSGWFAGVHTAVFLSRFLGISYDAPSVTLRFAPFFPSGDFSWTDFPAGNDRFSLSYHTSKGAVHVTLTNLNPHPASLEATLPASGNCRVSANGVPVETTRRGRYLERDVLTVRIEVRQHACLELLVEPQ